MGKVLVFVEQRNNVVKKASLEAVTTAKKFGEVEAVCTGANVEGLGSLTGYGAAKVTHLKSADFENYTPSGYAKAFADYAKDSGAEVVLFANTAMGKDLAPRVAVKLNAGLAVDVVSFNGEGADATAVRPVYAGKALVEVKVNSAVKVYTLRPNTFAAVTDGSTGDVNVVEISDVDLGSKVVEIKKSEGKLDVAEADVIVSGGRGLKGPEHFNLVEDLADSLGAAVGASRAVVDAGWRPHSEQVGQTGKTVSPSLYVAVGISGAIQHLAGMRSSKYIVAINKDKDAPIFQVADYGIVADAFDILPELTNEIKKIKAE